MLNGVKGKDDGDSDSLSALPPEVQPPRQDRHSEKLRHDPAKSSSNFNCGKGIRDERAKFTQKNERLYK